jgi:Peptidase MA superfamily
MTEKDHIYDKMKSVIRDDGKGSSYIGEDDFVSLVKGGITINFHIKQKNLDVENVFRTVKRAQKLVKDRLGHELNNIDIEIYDCMEEMRQDGRSRSRYASWIAGIYDGKIRIISEKDDDEPEALYIILTHEIIHLAVAEIGRGKCPYWLDEGLAVYMSQELPDHYARKLSEAVRKDKILPLDVLEKPLPADTDEDILTMAYAEASSITSYLVEFYGWDKVKSIVDQCMRRPITAVLADISLNYYLLEQGWKRWIKGKSA